MSQHAVDRQLLRIVRTRLPEWIAGARVTAYNELFTGPDPELSEAELDRLDAVDSELARTGERLWGADEYGIVAADPYDVDGPLVVCTYHPQIPETTIGGKLDEGTHERLNDALWEYAERVRDLLQEDVEAFLEDHDRGIE